MESNKNRSVRTVTENIIIILLFAAISAFLFWKCKYGFGNIDESFYLTIPYRLYQGDSLFGNEWHLSQMSSFLLLPFVSAYMAIFKSTAGIILSFRYLYVIVQMLASACIYLKLKAYSKIGAAAAAAAFMIYAPFAVSALSYNSLGITCLTLSAVLVCTCTEKSKAQPVFAGLLYAGAVLCCPYLAVLYVILTAVVFIRIALRKNRKDNFDVFSSIKFWALFTVGTAVLAAAFLVFVLSRVSISEIADALPHMLNDPEHRKIGLSQKMKYYHNSIIFQTENSTKPVYFIFAAAFVVMLADKNRKQHRARYLALFSIIIIALFQIFFIEEPYINYLMFPMSLMAPVCVVLFGEYDEIKKLFFSFWISGAVYTLCVNLTSNEYFYVISSVSTVSVVGSIVMLAVALSKLKKDGDRVSFRLAAAVTAVLISVQLGTEASMRYSQLFWEDSMSVQTVLIEDGPEKGLLATPYKSGVYNNAFELKKTVESKYGKSKSILFLSENTWQYLIYENYENAAFSAWLSKVNDSSAERLKEYYRLNPEKLPDLIFVDAGFEKYADLLAAEYGFEVAEAYEAGTLFIR